MAIPNMFNFSRKPAEGSGNSGGNGNSSDNSNNQSSGGNGNSASGNTSDNSKDNKDPNAAMVEDIWKDIKDPKKDQNGNSNNQNNQNNNNNQQQQQQDPQKDVDNYLNGIGLGEFKLSEQDLEAFKSGEGVQGVLDSINKRIRDSHIKAVSAANTLLEKKIPELVDAAVNKSKSYYQGEQLRGLLQEKLPWTKDPVIAPMAETVLRQLLTKGATYEQGIEGTKKYFERVQHAMDPDYVAPNKQTQSSYRGNPNQNKTNTDWVKILAPGNNNQ